MNAPFDGPESWTSVQLRLGPAGGRPDDPTMHTLGLGFIDYCVSFTN